MSVYSALILAEASLVSYWRFGEASGGAAADQKAAHAGVYQGIPTLAQAGAISGDADTAVKFNGTSQYVSVVFSASLNTIPFSAEMWINPTSLPGNNTSFFVASSKNGTSPRRGWTLAITNTAGTITWTAFLSQNTTTLVTLTGSAASSGAWTHVVLTHDGATGRLYVNGVLANSVANAAMTANTADATFIGAGGNPDAVGVFTPGTFDEAALYNTALSLARIQTHYSAGLGRLNSDALAGAIAGSGSNVEALARAVSLAGGLAGSGSSTDALSRAFAPVGVILGSGVSTDHFTPPAGAASNSVANSSGRQTTRSMGTGGARTQAGGITSSRTSAVTP